MNTPNQLDTLKRKVYLAYHQDGILDLAAATTLLGFATFMATGNVVFLVLGAIFPTQYVLMKNRITIPRFGYVRFEPQEKTLSRLWFLLGLGVLAVLGVLALNFILKNTPTTPEFQAWLQRYHMLPLSAVLFGLPALAAAAFLGLKRFYLYALLVTGLPALAAWLNVETFVPILATGLIILIFGIALLSTFVKNYPVEK